MAKVTIIFVIASIGSLLAAPAVSGKLVYRPINPSFGGDPFYSSHLLGIADAINDHEDPNALDVDDIIDRIETEIPTNPEGPEAAGPAGSSEADLLSVPSQDGLLLPN